MTIKQIKKIIPVYVEITYRDYQTGEIINNPAADKKVICIFPENHISMVIDIE